VRGASGLISRLEPTEIVATIDLTDARPGVRVFPLTADHISVPLGVEVKAVDPSTVSLNLEKATTAEAVVRPTIDGEPAPGYEVGEVTIDPKTVVVVGPESRLKDRQSALTAVTERISIEAATATVRETVSMAMSDPTVRLRDPLPAQVTIKIVPAPVARFAGRPVMFRNLPTGRQVTADPPAVSVTVRGRHDALTALKDRELEPYVDLARLGPGRYNLPVHVAPRGDYTIATIEPATVTVTIR
jgi:YbbR domain-containing protein